MGQYKNAMEGLTIFKMAGGVFSAVPGGFDSHKQEQKKLLERSSRMFNVILERY